MPENFRRFEASDPFGRNWVAEFRWIQNAISIRHCDSVDVKFQLIRGADIEEKVIALRHPDLLELSKRTGRGITDAWCMKMAALHLREMIQTDRDMDKILVTPLIADLERHASVLDAPEPVRR
jgi:hypothetical protein